MGFVCSILFYVYVFIEISMFWLKPPSSTCRIFCSSRYVLCARKGRKIWKLCKEKNGLLFLGKIILVGPCF